MFSAIMQLILGAIFLLAMYAPFGFLVGRIAKRKGYDFWRWFFACGLLAIFFLAVIPNLNKANLTAEARERQRVRGNRIGEVMSAFLVLSFLGMVYVAVKEMLSATY